MKKQIEIFVYPEQLDNSTLHNHLVAKALKINENDITGIIPLRRSIDARKKPVFKILFDVFIGETPVQDKINLNYHPVTEGKNVIIVGCGPAGMFAALRLIELGIKPVILERGKDVKQRRKDLRAIQQNHFVNPDSNYCFGEGGAGTYSDGKLYTRAVKRGNVRKIIEVFIHHGAEKEIGIDSHPHIGSNKLPKIVESMRNTILSCGGEIHFNTKVTGLILDNQKAYGVIINNEEKLFSDAVILTTGHSARDVFSMLDGYGITLEPKSFAVGVRIEHPQSLINEIQYHTKIKPDNLPAAAYSLKCEVGQRGIYSFCMCPGGIIVPASTAPGEIVVNGMSLSRRNSPFANSGLVIEINSEDLIPEYHNKKFPGLEFQKDIEQLAFRLANNTQSAPAQRATDFLNGKFSQSLPASSYIPGLTSARLDKEFPQFLVHRLKTALKIFDKKMKGYLTEEAVLVAVESRTSSPIRVLRDKETMMHVAVDGLFPGGEGAGYAGGIVSAAIDGENIANAVYSYLQKNS